MCARSRCDDDDAQNDEKSRRGVKGMFCKSSARVAFVLLWRFFQSERGKKRDFSEKEHKKEILSRFFSCVFLRCWFPPSANLILSSQKVASFVEILSAYMVDQLVFYEVTPSYV